MKGGANHKKIKGKSSVELLKHNRLWSVYKRPSSGEQILLRYVSVPLPPLLIMARTHEELIDFITV